MSLAEFFTLDLSAAPQAFFSADELVELYERGTAWCLQAAMGVAPEQPWAWEAGVVVDAAFARYLRDAVDYAGGRREINA